MRPFRSLDGEHKKKLQTLLKHDQEFFFSQEISMIGLYFYSLNIYNKINKYGGYRAIHRVSSQLVALSLATRLLFLTR